VTAKTTFVLDRKDVSCGWRSGAIAKHRKHRNRKLDVRCSTVTATHKPTGVAVSGDIPWGHYSKTELQEKRRALFESLLPQLEKAVRRHVEEQRGR
jgi:hypothetical protein